MYVPTSFRVSKTYKIEERVCNFHIRCVFRACYKKTAETIKSHKFFVFQKMNFRHKYIGLGRVIDTAKPCYPSIALR